MFGSFVCIIEGILAPFFGFWSSIAARLDCKKQWETLYYFYNFLVCDLLWSLWQTNLSFLRRWWLYFQDFSIPRSSFAVFPCDMKPNSWKYASRPRWGALFCQPPQRNFSSKPSFWDLSHFACHHSRPPCSLKKYSKTCRFSKFSLFGPSCFEYASKLLIYLNVLPARAGSTFLQIGAQSCSTKCNFSAWMCLRMPSCRIWAAKQISKIPRKYVYYLHMSPSWGSLNFFDASNFLIFILFYFSPLHFPWFFNSIQI